MAAQVVFSDLLIFAPVEFKKPVFVVLVGFSHENNSIAAKDLSTFYFGEKFYFFSCNVIIDRLFLGEIIFLIQPAKVTVPPRQWPFAFPKRKFSFKHAFYLRETL